MAVDFVEPYNTFDYIPSLTKHVKWKFLIAGPISFGYACLEGGGMEHTESMGGSPVSASPSPPTPPLGEEMAAVQTVERSHQTDTVTQHNQVV